MLRPMARRGRLGGREAADSSNAPQPERLALATVAVLIDQKIIFLGLNKCAAGRIILYLRGRVGPAEWRIFVPLAVPG
jgi:hypothetical protein